MTEKTQEIKIFEQFSLSDVGLVRTLNEDRFVYADTVNGSLFVLSDGMGGIKGGDIAAQLTTDAVVEACSQTWESKPAVLLKSLPVESFKPTGLNPVAGISPPRFTFSVILDLLIAIESAFLTLTSLRGSMFTLNSK